MIQIRNTIILIIAFSMPASSQDLQAFKIKLLRDTILSGKLSHSGWYYIQPTNNHSLVFYNWNTKRSHFTSFNFDSIDIQSVNKLGHIIKSKDSSFYRVCNDRIYHYDALKRKEKIILKSSFSYKGIKYVRYIGHSKENEGYNVIYDSISNCIIIPIRPKSRSDIFANILIQKKVYVNAALLIKIGTNGKIVATYGKYDSIYNYLNAKKAGIIHFALNAKDRKLIITQKASKKIQICNLDNEEIRMVDLNVSNLKGDFQNYSRFSLNDSQENIYKLLIESPSFNDVYFDESVGLYYILRTDSACDTTWKNVSNENVFKKGGSFSQPRKVKVCKAGSNQLFNQLKLYSHKPLYLQVYNNKFEFVSEFKLSETSSIRFMNFSRNGVILYDPINAKSIYRLRLTR